MNNTRLTFTESFKIIKQQFEGLVTGIDGEPYTPPGIPNFDDEKLGIGFFRGSFKDNRLGNLTIPRTYFGHSEFNNISFKNSDLSESRMCWNDWIECDFSESTLKGSDLRNSIFKNCSFQNANLENADLRHTTFENCDFSGASMKGTKIKKASGIFERFSPKTIKTDKKQNLEIDWQKENGPEAPGG